MEEKKGVFEYLGQVLLVFGFSMLVLNVFCLLFGDSARPFSAMFALGRQGVPAAVAFQFLCVSALIAALRVIFFTDCLIRGMTLRLRTVCMLTATVGILAVFIAVFHWFPIHLWQPWALFLLCFTLSFLGSYLVVRMREKAENRRMEQALQRLKEKERCSHE